MKKICYFGIYDSSYARNKNIIKAFRQNGVEVVEVIDKTSGPIKYWKLLKKYLLIEKDFDLMIVGFPGQIIVPFAKLLTNKIVVFDLHVSYYDSIILERKKYPKVSIQALYFYFLDWFSCLLADYVLIDTRAHASYVSKLLHIPEDKFIIVYHGIDDGIFVSPEKLVREDGKFVVSFHGYIQLLNGMDLVLHAMKKLEKENIELWIIGGGTEYKNMQALSRELSLSNVIFFPPMKPEDLVVKVSSADLGLGFFSQSKKIDRVIANKVYELMALKVPVLSGESLASKELFEHKKHIFYCKRGDSNAIAHSMLELKSDRELRMKMAENAYKYVQNNLTPKVLGKKIIPIFENLLLQNKS
jgi:glycosyltransferase involved in cell wall biosynthesis